MGSSIGIAKRTTFIFNTFPLKLDSMQQARLKKRFKDFMKKISAWQKIAVVHHRDTDGICSALLFSKALEKLRGTADYHEKKAIKEKLLEFKPDKIVFLDLSIDQFPEFIRELESIAPILILDHHKIYNDLNSSRTVFIKSQMLSELDGSNYPASKLCFDLCSGLIDLSNETWIACVGLLGDMSYDSWKDFFNETIARLKISLNELKQLKEIISAVEVLAPEKFPELFNDFYSMAPAKILSGKFKEFVSVLENEIKKHESEFEKKAEFFPSLELYFFTIRSDKEIKSAVIDRLTLKHPNKTIIVFGDNGKPLVRFSARRQDFKIKMNELLEKATASIPGASGGGHIPAAAGSVPREHLEEFKENIKKILRQKLLKRK